MPIAPDDEELRVKTGGRTLGGWLSFQVFRGIERQPSGFAISVTEVSPGVRDTAVEPFAPCEVFLSGDKVLTGYIDHYAPAMDAHNHEASIQGRSKTEDLVDCSVELEKSGWVISSVTIGEAAKKICEPYNIEVTGDGMSAPLGDPKYPVSVKPGETCWQVLEELARIAQVLIWDDAEGRLVLSKVGTKRAATSIVEGQNAEIAGSLFTAEDRFSDIWVVASTWVDGTEGDVGYFSKTMATIARCRDIACT